MELKFEDVARVVSELVMALLRRVTGDFATVSEVLRCRLVTDQPVRSRPASWWRSISVNPPHTPYSSRASIA